MIPRVGNSGSDIPVETQMLLLEAREGMDSQSSEENNSYIIFLPVLDGAFRSSLQGNSFNELELCVESGKEKTSAYLYIIHFFSLKLCSSNNAQVQFLHSSP